MQSQGARPKEPRTQTASVKSNNTDVCIEPCDPRSWCEGEKLEPAKSYCRMSRSCKIKRINDDNCFIVRTVSPPLISNGEVCHGNCSVRGTECNSESDLIEQWRLSGQALKNYLLARHVGNSHVTKKTTNGKSVNSKSGHHGNTDGICQCSNSGKQRMESCCHGNESTSALQNGDKSGTRNCFSNTTSAGPLNDLSSPGVKGHISSEKNVQSNKGHYSHTERSMGRQVIADTVCGRCSDVRSCSQDTSVDPIGTEKLKLQKNSQTRHEIEKNRGAKLETQSTCGNGTIINHPCTTHSITSSNTSACACDCDCGPICPVLSDSDKELACDCTEKGKETFSHECMEIHCCKRTFDHDCIETSKSIYSSCDSDLCSYESMESSQCNKTEICNNCNCIKNCGYENMLTHSDQRHAETSSFDCMEAPKCKSARVFSYKDMNVCNGLENCNCDCTETSSRNCNRCFDCEDTSYCSSKENNCCTCDYTADHSDTKMCSCMEANNCHSVALCDCDCVETYVSADTCSCSEDLESKHSSDYDFVSCSCCEGMIHSKSDSNKALTEEAAYLLSNTDKIVERNKTSTAECCIQRNKGENNTANDSDFDDNESEPDFDNSMVTVVSVKNKVVKHNLEIKKNNSNDSKQLDNQKCVSVPSTVKALGRKELQHLTSTSFSSDSALTDTSSICEWADESSDAAKRAHDPCDINVLPSQALTTQKTQFSGKCIVTSPRKLRRKMMLKSKLADGFVDYWGDRDGEDSDSSLEFTTCCTGQLLSRSRLGSQLSEKSTESDVLSPAMVEQSEAPEIEQKSSRTCDLLTGLHYAIPFLSEKLKISLSNRLSQGTAGTRSGEQRLSGSHGESGVSSDRCSVLSEEENGPNGQRTSSGTDEHPKGKDYGTSCPEILNTEVTDCNDSNHVTKHNIDVTSTAGHVTHTVDHVTKYPDTITVSFQGSSESSQNSSPYASIIYGDDNTCVSDSLRNLDLGGNAVGISSIPQTETNSQDHVNASSCLEEASVAKSCVDGVPKSISDILGNLEKMDALERVFLSDSDSHSESEYGAQSADDDEHVVPSLFSTNSSDSWEADDEFECDCQHCQDRSGHAVVRGYCHGNSENLDMHGYHCSRDQTRGVADSGGQDRSAEASGEMDNRDSDRSNFELWLPERDEEEGLYRISIMELSPLEQLMNDRRNELEIMFENVILQMLAVHPDLLSDHAPPPVSKATINSLPSSIITSEHLEQNPSCPICLCILTENETITTLPCSHIFHPLCIQAWLVKSGTCPVCRHTL